MHITGLSISIDLLYRGRRVARAFRRSKITRFKSACADYQALQYQTRVERPEFDDVFAGTVNL